MRRGVVLIGAAILVTLAASFNADAAATQTGKVRFPCVSPAPTSNGVPQLGDMCGAWVNVTPGAHYTLTPNRPADLDIHFYRADGTYSGFSNAGTGVLGTGCGVLSGDAPAAATKAIVVATANACFVGPPVSNDPAHSEMDIPFTFTQ